jgi:hypothetical protein
MAKALALKKEPEREHGALSSLCPAQAERPRTDTPSAVATTKRVRNLVMLRGNQSGFRAVIGQHFCCMSLPGKILHLLCIQGGVGGIHDAD